MIAATLEEDIALGYLAPHERLVEEDLAERFTAKRHMVREALVELNAMGIVVRYPNRGAAVKEYSDAEVEQLYLVRALVESCAAKFIPLPAPTAVVHELIAVNASYGASIDRGNLRQVFRENLRFHNTLFAACGNSTLVEVIEELTFRTHAIRSFSIGDPKLLDTARAEHARMIELLQTRDRRALVELVKTHHLPAKNAYLRQSRRKRLAELS